jgi:folate-binding protein YgfZ
MLIADPMPFKDNRCAQVPTVLAAHGVVAADGPQAAAFLQAQVMSDVAALAVGQWHWSGWLNAKGRVIALFALLRTGEESFRLLVPDLPAAELQAALARFVFRAKVHLSALPDGACVGEWNAPALPARDIAMNDGGDWCLDVGGDDAARRLWLLAPESTRPRAAADAGNDDAWLRCDLQHGLPRLPAPQREQWTPQMLSLQRLRAFSLKKGCYPGQEIVARTHFLGQAKRELVLLSGHGLHAGAGVQREGQAVGTVVCNDAAGAMALAVLAVEASADAVTIAAEPAERMALAGGLQRPA